MHPIPPHRRHRRQRQISIIKFRLVCPHLRTTTHNPLLLRRLTNNYTNNNNNLLSLYQIILAINIHSTCAQLL